MLTRAAQGEAPLSRDLAAPMIEAQEAHSQAQARLAVLSAREVLELVALGARNGSIAQSLAISELRSSATSRISSATSHTVAGAFYRATQEQAAVTA